MSLWMGVGPLWRVVVNIAMGVLWLGVALGCGSGSTTPTNPPPQFDRDGLPIGTVTYKFLLSRFEGRLWYPGAARYRSLGVDEQDIGTGKNSAFAGGIWITPDPPEKIYAWYRAQLLPRGWRDYPIGLGGAEMSVKAYIRASRERFNVGIDDPKFLGTTLGTRVPDGATVFEERYLVFPNRK